MEIILFEPDIPQNTGNIIRLCKATGCSLTLVEPLGFSMSDKHLKRSQLDYCLGVSVKTIPNLKKYLESTNRPKYFFSSKAKKSYYGANITSDALLIFGSETTGLPQYAHEKWQEDFYTIPMKKEARCLNLANSVSIAAYEGIRQQHFSSQQQDTQLLTNAF